MLLKYEFERSLLIGTEYTHRSLPNHCL